jgi:hypothetical protein
VLAVGALTVLATKGWPPHLLLLVPPMAVIAAVSIGEFARGPRIGFALVGVAVIGQLGYGVRETLAYDHHARWTFERVTEQDYDIALRLVRHADVRTMFTFPSPIPEFYFDAGVRAAGFDAENDHRSAIGRSADLQQRFRDGFDRNRPELCVEIAPRPGNERFVDPAYARFVHELVAARGRRIVASGGVTLWDCRRSD